MNDDPSKTELNRREFLRHAGAVGGLALTLPLVGCGASGQRAAGTPPSGAGGIVIVSDASTPAANTSPARWAVGELVAALAERGVPVRASDHLDENETAEVCIVVGAFGNDFPHGLAESFDIVAAASAKRTTLSIMAGNALGFVYALTELSHLVRHSPDVLGALRSMKSVSEKPHNRIRSVMRLFCSDVEDKAWFNDREFWKRYLTMLVSQRFNRFNLALGLGYDSNRRLTDSYFFFAYPFLVSVPGYDVRATGVSDAERDSNLRMLKFISEEAAGRGLHFQLGLWTHSYQAVDSPNVNHVIQGLDAEHHAAYCRDALQMILETCPAMNGVTFRVHGESGVAEGSYDFWKTVFDGIVRTGRKIEIDMHAKGMDQGMIDVALATGLPVNISPKFWAEHMGLPYHQASIREAEMPVNRPTTGQYALSGGSRSFLRYGYGDLLKANRKHGVLHRIWPGTQRLLLWADPKFAAEYARIFTFCGSDGVEIFDPLSFKGREGSGLKGDRGGYVSEAMKPTGGDWEKYLPTYRLWGRLTYNPDTDPEVFHRPLLGAAEENWGPSSALLESALAQSSRILPLITTTHLPSAANANYWPEIYTNMSIVDPSHPGSYGETPRPRVFGNVSPLDPQLFAGINEYCDALMNGNAIAKVSPMEVAQQLQDWSDGAFADLAKVGHASSASARRATVDCAIAAGIGRFFAWKIRAAMLFGVFDRTGVDSAHAAGLAAYRKARDAWAQLASTARDVYAADLTFGPTPQLRGHWSDRVAAIEQDISAMENYTAKTTPSDDSAQLAAAIIQSISARQGTPRPKIGHDPHKSFKAGETIAIELTVPVNITSVRLWFRHIDQAERFSSVIMQRGADSHSAKIDGRYTDSPFSLQYYFELRDDAGGAFLHPGFVGDFCGQPYVVVQQA